MRRLAVLASLVVAGASTLATSMPPAPGTGADASFQVSLSADQPTDVRLVTVEFRHNGAIPSEVWLRASPTEFNSLESGDITYWVDIVPTDPSEQRPHSYSSLQGSAIGTTEASAEREELLNHCRSDCIRSYLVVTRLTDPADAPITTEVAVDAGAYYSGEGGDPPPSGAQVLLDIETESEDTPIATLSAHASGSALIGSQDRRSTWRADIDVTAAGVPDQQQLQAIGSIVISLHATPTTDDAEASAAVGTHNTYQYVDYLSADYPNTSNSFEWLSFCDPSTECSVPIEIEFTWEPDGTADPPATGAVTIEWTAEVTLEYIGADSPQDGAELWLTPD